MNEGCLDRCVRVAIGSILLTSFYFLQDKLWLLIGVIPLVTGFIGWCGLYTLLGISTVCKTEKIGAKK